MAITNWCYQVEGNGNLCTYTADSEEEAICLAECYGQRLSKAERKETTIEVLGYNIIESAMSAVDNCLYDSLEQAIDSLQGKNNKEIDSPFDGVLKCISITA